MVWGRPGHQPWNLLLCIAPDGTVVGATHVYLTGGDGYVARIAVRKDRRGLGLGAAMLADAFTLARSTARCAAASPPTHARARSSLYEKVGMQVSSAWVNLALDL